MGFRTWSEKRLKNKLFVPTLLTRMLTDFPSKVYLGEMHAIMWLTAATEASSARQSDRLKSVANPNALVVSLLELSSTSQGIAYSTQQHFCPLPPSCEQRQEPKKLVKLREQLWILVTKGLVRRIGRFLLSLQSPQQLFLPKTIAQPF